MAGRTSPGRRSRATSSRSGGKSKRSPASSKTTRMEQLPALPAAEQGYDPSFDGSLSGLARLKRFDLAVSDADLLQRALFAGDAESVDDLMKNNAQLAKRHSWQSIFDQSVECETQLPVAALALQMKADVNHRSDDSSKSTALMRCVTHGPAQCWAFLLEQGADLLQGDSSFNTLQQAVLQGNVAYLKHASSSSQGAKLLDAPDKERGHGCLLWLALHCRKPAMVLELLVLGADANPTQSSCCGDASILHKLISVAPLDGQADVLAALIQAGTELERRDEQGLTPLLLASQGGQLDLARVLLQHGADAGATDQLGQNALLLAVTSPLANTQPKLCRAALLDQGVAPDRASHSGMTCEAWVATMQRDQPADARWAALGKVLGVAQASQLQPFPAGDYSSGAVYGSQRAQQQQEMNEKQQQQRQQQRQQRQQQQQQQQEQIRATIHREEDKYSLHGNSSSSSSAPADDAVLDLDLDDLDGFSSDDGFEDDDLGVASV